MRALSSSSSPLPASAATSRSDWGALRRLLPYLWQYRWRVGVALAFMVAAKSANVGVPVLLKHLIDAMSLPPNSMQALWVVPAGLLLAYGLLRFSTTLFTELRELVFAKATEGATRHIALQVFEHLHGLSLRFHLDRQTGGLTRDIERGTRGVQSLISFSLYSIFPTLIEVALVLGILGWNFDQGYVWITLTALIAYGTWTVKVTEWRTHFRREMNRLDSDANSQAIDSLINYETVKYFNNERFEAERYDRGLEALRLARIKSQSSLSLLNAGQQLIIATALVLMLWRATQGVANGSLSLGDLVMVNGFMIQLYIPLGFLGTLYREIKQNLTDLDRMFTLMDRPQEVRDAQGAQPLRLSAQPHLRFEGVRFAYDPDREVLHGLDFEVPPGHTVAVVGPSGSGKSTLARLLYRFYDVSEGRITIDGQDLREVTQDSVRQAIGIVPQDTVLFNNTVAYNIRYGRPEASDEAVYAAARAARIHDFVSALPKGYETMVGERGLKLSGGEKQRVAIARTLLKNPAIVIFDEATSALDSANERAIQSEIRTASVGKTTLVVAHRLSTIVHAHEILVMDSGRIVERGTHAALLAAGGRYAEMWAMQQQQPEQAPKTQAPEQQE